jgi:hypothetical protein
MVASRGGSGETLERFAVVAGWGAGVVSESKRVARERRMVALRGGSGETRLARFAVVAGWGEGL